MEAHPLVTDYLLLGLAFDRLEEGFVDAYTGDPALRRKVENAPTPDPRDLSHTARRLRDELPGAGLSDERTRYLDVHLRALDCSGRRSAGEELGFVDGVEAYVDGRIERGDEGADRYAHRRLDAWLAGTGSLTERMQAPRKSEVIPGDRL